MLRTWTQNVQAPVNRDFGTDYNRQRYQPIPSGGGGGGVSHVIDNNYYNNPQQQVHYSILLLISY